MPDASSAKTWPTRVRLGMIALNFLPLLHLAAVLASLGSEHWWMAVGILFLLPPLLVRALLWIAPIQGGSHALGSRDFMVWWATAQSQMIFCRLPFLEELLRLVPGLYSLWLRLWGARIGRLTFWSPGLRILDRSFLRVGNYVVFGAGARLNAHVIARDESVGEMILSLAPIEVGDNAHVGGYSLLTAGTVVDAGEQLKAFSLSPPFTHWTNNRRTKPAIPT